jgi:hypothetical protein
MSAVEFLAESKRIEEAATPGEWRAGEDRYAMLNQVRAYFEDHRHSGNTRIAHTYAQAHADAEFIAHARTALPRMREALQAVMSWAERDLERAQPKYGEYAEGLSTAQQLVREVIESALAENGGTDV